MTIKRNLSAKVQGSRMVLDSPIYFYQGDRDICLVITITGNKYIYDKDTKLSFIIVKPNGEVVENAMSALINGKYNVLLTRELFDGEDEVGQFLCQLRQHNGSAIVSLPPFAIHVLKGYSISLDATDGLLTEQEYMLLTENMNALSVGGLIKISDLPQTENMVGYAPVTQGDTTYKLDISKIATKDDLKNVTIDTSNLATKQELTDALATKADKSEIPSLDGYATENYVQTKIAEASLGGEIDLSAYATKNEVNSSLATKSDVGHVHSEYLTSQDISMKADKSEIPTLTSQLTNDSGFITTIPSEYVTDEELNAKGYLTEHQSLDHLATKQELTEGLTTKAEVNHTHSYNDLTDKPTIPSIDGLATTEYVDNAVANVIIDTSDLATKQELSNGLSEKADKVHTHSEYLTEHQDLSDYALKTEIPTVPTKVSELTNDSGYLTTIPSEYITETELDAKGYLTEHQDISGLATKQELTSGLNTKSDTTHNHDDMYSKLDHTHNGMLTSNSIIRIEVVDALPSEQETGVLYIVKASE